MGAFRRVALAVGYPSGFEDEIVRGAIDHAEQVRTWRFVGHGHRPFQPFEEIDLGAVDGVIGIFYDRSWADAVERAGVKAVNTSTRHADLPLPRVGNDDEAVGRLGAEHLLSRGFEHFGFVTQVHAWYANRRLTAFRGAVRRSAGSECLTLELKNTPANEKDKVAQWLARLPRPIAIMATNDSMAMELIDVAIALGLRIPDDLAVLGVDNDLWASVMSAVPLSSVQINARQIGYRAAQLLDRLMAGEPAPAPMWVPPIGVVTRRSTDIVLAEDALVARALRYIRDHCNRALTVDEVVESAQVSRRSLEMRMKRAVGLTPQGAIFRAQIERAKELLTQSGQTMGQIAESCGFTRQEHFSAVFKRDTGSTPGQYRHQTLARLAAGRTVPGA